MKFTHREHQVLCLLAQGLCNKSISKQLGISPYTVRDHVCSMLLRTGCANRLQLALQHGTQHHPTRTRTRTHAAFAIAAAGAACGTPPSVSV